MKKMTKLMTVKKGYQKPKELRRFPTLHTILMIEGVLKKNRETPMKLPELKKKLPKQVMHQTLMITLDYLFKSGKIL